MSIHPMIAHTSTLLDALKDAPDPRQARGQRYAWLLLLTRMGGAWVSGQRTPHAMADWVRLHTVELREALHVARERLASEATVRRVLRGARAYGATPHLVSVVQHASGLVLAETAATEKSNEITAVSCSINRPGWSTNAPPSIRSNVFPTKGTGGMRCAPWNAVLP